jgi:hypothetical protein
VLVLIRGGALVYAAKLSQWLPRYEEKIGGALLDWLDTFAPTNDASKARGLDEHRAWRDLARSVWDERHFSILTRFASQNTKIDACTWNLR